MVTIASFTKPEDAHLLRMGLEAGGVPALVRDENIVQVNWLWSDAVGGVRVEVNEAEVDRVREILRDEGVANNDVADLVCPACGSSATHPDDTRRRFALLTLVLFALPWLWPKNRYRCTACGKRWTRQ